MDTIWVSIGDPSICRCDLNQHRLKPSILFRCNLNLHGLNLDILAEESGFEA
jgi:hypothetical protein